MNLRTIVYIIFGLVVLWLIVSLLTPSTGANTSNLQPSDRRNDEVLMVSSVQPISEPISSTESNQSLQGNLFIQPVSAAPGLSESASQQLKESFDEAVQAQQVGDLNKATLIYRDLIEKFPYTPESYINLAAVIAEQGDLDVAKDILQQGINKNQQAALLFQSLSRANALKAAQAYKQALDVKSEPKALGRVSLPVANQLISQPDLRDQILVLQSKLNDSIANNSGADELIQQYQSTISDLQSRLQVAESKATDSGSQVEQITRLQAELSKSAEALVKSEAAEREALARVVRAEQDSATKQQQADKLVGDLRQQIAQLKRDALATNTSVLASRVESVNSASTRASMSANNRSQAIARVKSWAAAWSRQNVDAYVAHYENGYSSSPSLTHQQWREQRRVRLTNKSFIDVSVSNFSVEDSGDTYSVTFNQHYRSDVIDDVVRKRLTFIKNGQDWSAGRINRERLVR